MWIFVVGIFMISDFPLRYLRFKKMNRFSGFKVYWDRSTNHQTEKQKKTYLQGVPKRTLH